MPHKAGHNMNMGSKEKNTPGNFSENDTKTISNSPTSSSNQKSEYEIYKSTAKNRFPNFNVDKDSMIVTYHGDEMTSKRHNTTQALFGKKKGLLKSVSASDGKTEYNGELYRQSNVYPKTNKGVTAHAKHAEKTN